MNVKILKYAFGKAITITIPISVLGITVLAYSIKSFLTIFLLVVVTPFFFFFFAEIIIWMKYKHKGEEKEYWIDRDYLDNH
jgi:hypothetical protein